MTAQSVAVGFTVAAVCGVLAFIALMLQAGRHSDVRAVLLRGQLDAYRAGQASVMVQVPEDEPWPESVLLGDGEEDRFWSIAAELGYDGGEAP